MAIRIAAPPDALTEASARQIIRRRARAHRESAERAALRRFHVTFDNGLECDVRAKSEAVCALLIARMCGRARSLDGRSGNVSAVALGNGCFDTIRHLARRGEVHMGIVTITEIADEPIH